MRLIPVCCHSGSSTWAVHHNINYLQQLNQTTGTQTATTGNKPFSVVPDYKYPKMKVDFKVEQNYAISFNDRLIDLHNNFDFVGFEYGVKPMSLVMKWKKTNGDWVSDEEFSAITLLHKEVSYLSVTARDLGMPTSDDACLSEITYFPSTERDVNDSIIYQDYPNIEDDILYIFMGGQSIRVRCAEIELVIT